MNNENDQNPKSLDDLIKKAVSEKEDSSKWNHLMVLKGRRGGRIYSIDRERLISMLNAGEEVYIPAPIDLGRIIAETNLNVTISRKITDPRGRDYGYYIKINEGVYKVKAL